MTVHDVRATVRGVTDMLIVTADDADVTADDVAASIRYGVMLADPELLDWSVEDDD